MMQITSIEQYLPDIPLNGLELTLLEWIAATMPQNEPCDLST